LIGAGFGSARAGGHGLIAYWPFEEGFASASHPDFFPADARGKGSVVIDPVPGAARVGTGALKLAAAKEQAAFLHVAGPVHGAPDSGHLSVTCWFKLDESPEHARNNAVILATMPVSGISLFLAREGKKRFLSWEFRARQERVRGRGPAVKPGAWHHAAVVWDEPSRLASVYLNGVQVAAEPLPDDPRMDATRGLHIGDNKQGRGAWNWSGWLDDLAVFDVPLTPRQIKALADGNQDGHAVTAANVLAEVPEPDLQQLNPAPLSRPVATAAEDSIQGPLIGHVDERAAVLWARVPEPGTHTVTATNDSGETHRAQAVASGEGDWCLHWHLPSLRPATRYRCVFTGPDGATVLKPLTIQTAPDPRMPGQAAIGFGSCDDFADTALWPAIRRSGVEGFVLLGDTPYIDTTEIKWVRWAYRRYSSVPGLVETFQRIPFWGTWDDHDFGANDSYGTLPGKEFTRRGFVEYRPNLSFGEGDQGVFTRFRRGPVEVFLLDTRWFSETEPSWADSSQPTLLGRRQWEWLRRGLRTSDAPFKILACGMIWDSKSADKPSDDWGRYPYERDALFRWIGDHNISGVLLAGGDIHVSRLLKHPTRALAGYDIPELVTSPMHSRVLPEFDRPHPALIASSREPHTFLKIHADNTPTPPVLRAEWIDSRGRVLFSLNTTLNDLSRSTAPPTR
jgi:alkaline phosphatase D